jgi:Protein of unknown function (DUF992)
VTAVKHHRATCIALSIADLFNVRFDDSRTEAPAMRRSTASLATVVVLLTLAAPAGARAQASWTQVGMLSCNLAPSVGMIIASQQRMTCRYTPNGPYPPQNYAGVMTSVGLDIGVTAGGVLGWAVLSPTMGPPAGGLAGTYVGASGEVTVGIGAGANVLIGGSARSVALQPVSVEGTTGLNLQLGVSNLELTSVP